MWYEIIPSAFLAGGLLVVPHLVIPYVNQFLYGTPMDRDFNSWYYRHMRLRDERLGNGNYHNTVGLENIPDA